MKIPLGYGFVDIDAKQVQSLRESILSREPLLPEEVALLDAILSYFVMHMPKMWY